MKKIIIILLTMICFSRAYASENKILLEVKAFELGCDIKMQSSITNNSEKTLTLNSNSLPWNSGVLGFSLIIQKIDPSREILKQIYGIDDVFSNVKIQPGETIKGDFSLKERFSGFREAIKRSDMVLYWNYTLKSKDEKKGYLYVGAIPLTKCEGL